jgi:FkbM family methyltransferase
MSDSRTGGYLAARARVVTAALLWGARWTPYVEAEMLGLRDLVGEGSVCIDVGSAVGVYTLALSRLAGPSGAVHSVEPLSGGHRACARLLRAREAGNVHPHDVALGAAPGRAVMKVPVKRSGLVTGRSFLAQHACGLGANTEFHEHVSVPVQVDTLDQLCAHRDLGRVDFIKIDVEGAELQVLQGSESVVRASRPTMLVEIEQRHTARYGQRAEEVVRWLAGHGYSMHTWDGAWREADTVCPDVRNYLFRPDRVASTAPATSGRPASPSPKTSEGPVGGARDQAA